MYGLVKNQYESAKFMYFSAIIIYQYFRFAAVGALLTAALVCFSILTSIILQVQKEKEAEYTNPTFSSFSLSFGTILFSFGGAFVFPTIQNDMAKRQEFNKASVLGFTGIYWILNDKQPNLEIRNLFMHFDINNSFI